MMSFLLIAAPLMAMAGAYLTVLQAGYMAGRGSEEQQLGIGMLALCIALVLAQAVLWVLWALRVIGTI